MRQLHYYLLVILVFVLLQPLECLIDDDGTCDGDKCEGCADDGFRLTVVILTMNRPRALARLLRSLEETDFEHEQDSFDVEVHVDKAVGTPHEDCVR